MRAYELVFEEEAGSFLADKQKGGCSSQGTVSGCKAGSEVRGHMASGYDWPGGASPWVSELKDRIWPQDCVDKPSVSATLSPHYPLSWAEAKKA